MKYVPSLPPPRISGVWDRLMVSGLMSVKAVKPVQPRTLPPLVVQHDPVQARTLPPLGMPPHEPYEPTGESVERRHDPHTQSERRVFCRRLWHLPVLIELRSGLERRRHKQRAGDLTEHIDIEA